MAMNWENEIIAKDDVDDGIRFLAHSIESSIPSSIPSNPSTPCSIYRVPDNLKKGYEEKYVPSVVSIGPYHCAKQNLKVTEKHKLWYLRNFMCRSTPPKASLKDMVKVVKNLEEKARACYAEEIQLSSDDFVKMMVIDGCFILELFYRHHIQFSSEEDLIYSAPWLIETVKQDLVLLENQLPFIILECLYQFNEYPGETLDKLVFHFFNGRLFFAYPTSGLVKGSNILEFLRNNIIPGDFNPSACPASQIHKYNFPCAIDLHEMGVKFQGILQNNALDVIFEEGCLKIPFYPIEIMYYLFPNLIALEQCHPHFKGYITSYILLLGQLVKSKDDVKFLRKMGIFNGNENEDKKFVNQLSGLRRRAKPIEYHYCRLPNTLRGYTRPYSLRRYTRSWWNRQRAKWLHWTAILMHDYCGTPWKVISFIAAVILLVLTAIQTIYTILSYSPKYV